MLKQTRVMLPEDVHTKVKVAAAIKGVSIATWIATAIEQRLAQPVKAQKKVKAKA
jgi:predicted HicB family RNase H-like nuclease